MSNPVIIHISDLHISDHSDKLGNKPNKYSFLDSNIANSNNITFIDKFISKVSNKFPSNRKILLVTGDTSNVGETIEFNAGHNYLNKIITDLNINKNDVCLVPGDHDVHRESISKVFRETPDLDKNPYELIEEKFGNYSKFYNDLIGVPFDSLKVIFKTILLSENTILIGVNSNYKIGNSPANGYIIVEQFEAEMSEIKSEHPNVKNFIIGFHHNISGNFENKITGQWETDNRSDIIYSFQSNDIKMILYGNEHTPKSCKLDSTGIYISDSGALSSTNPLGTFKCYEYFEEENKHYLKNNLFTLLKHNNVTETTAGDWIFVDPPSQRHNEEDEFIILDNTSTVAQSEFDLDIPEASTEAQAESAIINEEFAESIYLGEYSEKIYEIIKKKKLFHSGHFHWSETSRAHNWIDITKLLENKDDLFTVKSSIIDIIETFELHKNCDLIIGLGYEGNIISSKAAIKYNIPYSSLPYSYRYNDHHAFEKELYFKNDDKKYKNVIIITDVVNDGRTIRKLMRKENREKAFFNNVDKVTVISLFYSGERDLDVNVLNTKDKDFSENYDWENDYNDVDNIQYFTVAKLKVEKCPYKNNNYETDCVIYKDGLDCVHLFYNKSKV